MITRVVLVLLLFAVAENVMADDKTTTDSVVTARAAETARLKAETDLLAQENLLAVAKYGAAASPPTGAIANPEKLGAIQQWQLEAAYQAIGSASADFYKGFGSTCQNGAFVTSVADKRAALLAATTIQQKLTDFTTQLNGINPAPAAPPPGHAGHALAVPALLSMVGAADSLLGLLRADYTIADATATPDDTTARVAVAQVLMGSSIDTVVDGFDQRAGIPPLIATYLTFDTARARAQSRYAVEAAMDSPGAAIKLQIANDKALLDLASTFDTAITTPTSGATPLATAAMALEVSQSGRCTVYVHVLGLSNSVITRKKLLSRNDHIAAVGGGIVQFALFDSGGRLKLTSRVRLGEQWSASLDSFMSGLPKFPAAPYTSGVPTQAPGAVSPPSGH